MKLQDVLQKIEVLPPMPTVAVRLLEAAQDPDADLRAVATSLERDPAMTANMLRLCNSPYYGLSGRVASVRQATGLLGIRKIVEIALTVLSSRYLTPPQPGYDLAAGELWKGALTAAIAAEFVATETGYPRPSTAYTAGLLQDVGKIVVAEFVGGALAQIQELVSDGVPWEEAEKRTVGLPHPEAGALLLERWGFPAPLVEAVRTHHKPAEASLDPTLARICHLAAALAATLGLGLGADGMAYILDDESVRALGIADPLTLERFLSEVSTRATEMGRAI